jgi:hypothetical protein
MERQPEALIHLVPRHRSPNEPSKAVRIDFGWLHFSDTCPQGGRARRR